MHVTLHLSTRCNFRCTYCYSPPQDGPVMSDAVAEKALRLGLVQSGGSCGVIFFGGEPLLQKERIASIVALARGLETETGGRFNFKITTNGLLLDEDFLDFSIKNDIFVAMSFDGIREAHDRHRKFADGSGTFDILLPKLKMLLNARPYSMIMTVVNPDTARYFSDSMKFLIDQKARYLITSLNYAADWTESDFKVLAKQYRRLGRLYIKWTKENRKFYLSPFETKLSSHINRHCYQKERCELARHQISVDPEGYLFPCVQFPKAGRESEWCIGHVDTGIDESARARVHDLSQAEKEFCAPCPMKDRCHNTCGCLNWQTTGSVNKISPVLCRHEQLLVPIADRVGEILYKKRNPLFIQKHYNEAYPVLSLIEDAILSKDKNP